VRVIAAILGVTILTTAAVAADFDFRRADDPTLLRILRDLAVRSVNKADEMEIAAFIVKDESGNLSCLMWPHTSATRAARYSGVTPTGTVAIAHTHPVQAPQPSRADVQQSTRIGLPIYVVTRWNLYGVDPGSGESIVLRKNKEWSRAGSPVCRENWSLLQPDPKINSKSE